METFETPRTMPHDPPKDWQQKEAWELNKDPFYQGDFSAHGHGEAFHNGFSGGSAEGWVEEE